MASFRDDLLEYKNQMALGSVPRAYKGLMEYLMSLRTHFAAKHPDDFVSGSLYYGYMDMTYFSFVPKSLKQRDLKIAIVFLHEAFRFEAWLAASNKQVQEKYWKLMGEVDWPGCRLVPGIKGQDAILEQPLVADPDFSDPAMLTSQIEQAALAFTGGILKFLAEKPDPA